MLKITVPEKEGFDESKQEFTILEKAVELQLEHSLVSLSKWESKWGKPFLTDDKKTTEETLSYIQMMCLEEDVPSKVFDRLSEDNLVEINKYIESPMTATWFNEPTTAAKKINREVITAEIIYYWMISLNIPHEFETWHLRRLITLIKVINQKNAAAQDTTKKPPTRDSLASRRALNAKRRAEMGTSG